MKRRSLFFPSLLVVFTIMVASGACSQHSPGPYEGGGREMPTSVVGDIGGGPVGVDASVQDNFVPPDVGPDTFQLPDVGGGQG